MMSASRLPEPASAAVFEDSRGRLMLVEFNQLPFVPTRSYVLDEIPVGGRRAGHASRTQHRLLLGLAGRARVTLDNGEESIEVELAPPRTLCLPPGTWLEIVAIAEGTGVLVFADGDYDRSDIIEDRSQLPLTSGNGAAHAPPRPAAHAPPGAGPHAARP